MKVDWSQLGTRGLIALMIGLFSLVTLSLWRYRVRENEGKYSPVIPPELILILILLDLLFFPFAPGILAFTILRMLAAGIWMTAILWALSPLFRRRLSAEGCATLWLLPNLVLYSVAAVFRALFSDLPLFTVQVPRALLRWALVIWALGFGAVLGWKTVAHLRFRRRVLKSAVPLEGEHRELFLKQWIFAIDSGSEPMRRIDKQLRRGRKLPLLQSPDLASPLTVGISLRTAFLVLPRREYTPQELELIFRHEIVHLLHRDNLMKFTLTLLCAAGWFIPSLWAGMGRAAEELELCCDELATRDLEEARRRQYAELLLTNAGSAQGFTTCLSASASGLRYRLGRVLHPEKRRFGYLAAALLCACFAFLYGAVGVEATGITGRTLLLQHGGEPWQVTEDQFYSSDDWDAELEIHAEPAVCQALEEALRDLELAEPMDHRSSVVGPSQSSIWFHLGNRKGETIYGYLSETGLAFSPEGQGRWIRGESTYLYADPEQADFEGLRKLLTGEP